MNDLIFFVIFFLKPRFCNFVDVLHLALDISKHRLADLLKLFILGPLHKYLQLILFFFDILQLLVDPFYYLWDFYLVL